MPQKYGRIPLRELTRMTMRYVPHTHKHTNSQLLDAYLSIYSAYLAIRFDDLAVAPPLGRVLPLVEIFIHLGLNQDA